MRHASVMLAIVALTGCATRPVVPQVVKVPVVQVVAVPEELTRDCDQVPKKRDSYGEAVRLANARLESIQECTARMRQIRALKR